MTRPSSTLAGQVRGLRPGKNMGQGATRSQQLHHDVLMRIIKEQGYRLSSQKLTLLLLWINRNCPWYPESGTYELTEWNRVGETLSEAQKSGDDFSPDMLITWRILWLALTTLMSKPNSTSPSGTLNTPITRAGPQKQDELPTNNTTQTETSGLAAGHTGEERIGTDDRLTGARSQKLLVQQRKRPFDVPLKKSKTLPDANTKYGDSGSESDPEPHDPFDQGSTATEKEPGLYPQVPPLKAAVAATEEANPQAEQKKQRKPDAKLKPPTQVTDEKLISFDSDSSVTQESLDKSNQPLFHPKAPSLSSSLPLNTTTEVLNSVPFPFPAGFYPQPHSVPIPQQAGAFSTPPPPYGGVCVPPVLCERPMMNHTYSS
ncbi:endogenous retrovirus group K member 113 Gag polyprotein-like [Melanerpes formicivorus]|uniref:endogenous retrovirus group K member 113 Gag polyprotein-like n=1 Tax=Melanerpes formicivorus TaxID=211600 RepID=UPI00358F9A01